MEVGLGVSSTGLSLSLDLAAPWHIAIQGASRSGKSVTVYSLLGALAKQSNVIVTGCDPSAILLAPWHSHKGAEMRAVGTSELSAHVETIQRLTLEMDARIADLSDLSAGIFKDKLENFTPEIPLIVVVLEEYPGLLSALEIADKDALRKVRLGVRRLIQEGAKVGFRVVMIAQRFDASIVGGAERSNLGTRISHRVDNADAVRMLHSDASSELVEQIKHFSPGVGYLETPTASPQQFKSYMTSYEKYARHVVQMGATP